MTDDSAYPQDQQAPQPNPDLQALDRLVGTWNVSGGATGQVTYEWMEGRFFLVQHVDLEQYGQRLKGIEIIGHEKPFGAEPGPDVKSWRVHVAWSRSVRLCSSGAVLAAATSLEPVTRVAGSGLVRERSVSIAAGPRSGAGGACGPGRQHSPAGPIDAVTCSGTRPGGKLSLRANGR